MAAVKTQTINLEDDDEASFDEDDNEYDDEFPFAHTENEILSPLDESDIVKCNICSVNVIKTVLAEHKLAQHSTFTCPLCDKPLDRQSLMLDHLRDVHLCQLRSLNCPLCSRVVTRKSNLLQHILYQHFINQQKPIETKFKKNDTNEQMKPKKPHEELKKDWRECPTCHKNVLNLELHMLIHNRPFKCDKCSMTYDKEEHLNTHKLLHQKQGLNCRYCNMKCTSWENLMAHERSAHTLYSCPICGKRFLRRDALQKHARRSHGHYINKSVK